MIYLRFSQNATIYTLSSDQGPKFIREVCRNNCTSIANVNNKCPHKELKTEHKQHIWHKPKCSL
jgi:hypothetical protein